MNNASTREISPDVYSADYLLNCVEGFGDFKRGELSVVKSKEFELLDVHSGMKVLDVGFGRGDFLFHCAKRGANIFGVDYSATALGIAQNYLSAYQADLRLADARALPFTDNFFDRVCAGDVIEHINRPGAIKALQEMNRVLKPGGILLLHTTPNTVFTSFTYPVIRPILKLINRSAVKEVDYHLSLRPRFHIDEHNLFSLKGLLRSAGLNEAQVWIDRDIMRSGVHCLTSQFSHNWLGKIINPLGRFWIIRFFFGNDLYALYGKK